MGFIKWLAAECRRHEVDVLYPMSDITMYHVLKHRDSVGDVTIPYGPFEAYERQRALAGFWKPSDRNTYYEKNGWNDPGPFAYEVVQSARNVRPISMLRHVMTGLTRRLHHDDSRASLRRA